MRPLQNLWEKDTLRVIGLMSGTSADGMDAALTEITGFGLATRVKTLAFVSLPYDREVREIILRLASGQAGGSREMCLFSFLMGQLSLEACLAVCEKAGVAPKTVDLVGSHGQTLWHIPVAEAYGGRLVRGTLQLGEPSLICESLGCPVVSDFRVRDMAAGGQGAPLVPYVEYLLYRKDGQTVGLQNIGGIGNLTVLPKGGAPEDTFAFDTGPGNMVMDQIVERITDGRLRYDENGALAAQGRCSEGLLSWLLQDPYLKKSPPKSTGRELFGVQRCARYLDEMAGRAKEDILATLTALTARSAADAYRRFLPALPDEVLLCGGGARNPAVRAMLARELPECRIGLTEDAGLPGDSKEAVAFAVEELFSAGALDVFTTPAGMKKNRPAVLLTCLCGEAEKEAVLRALFLHTSTLGVREFPCVRHVLERETRTVETSCGPVRFKRSAGWGCDERKKRPASESI